MKKKSAGILVCIMMASVLIISVVNSESDRNISEPGKLCNIDNGQDSNNGSGKFFYQNNTDYEVTFTSPFDYADNGWSWDINSSEKTKWNNVSYADNTGLCMLNVSAMNVSKWGKAVAYAAIGGITVASDTYEKTKAEFYFSGKFKMSDDIFLASKTQIRILYFYYEDNNILNEGVLKEWQQETGSNEYIINYTENPLSIDLSGYRQGNTYKIVLYFEAYIEATGGSGTCYVDAFNTSLERNIHVEKIRLYDVCEQGSDLEVSGDSLEWDEVKPGSVQTGHIKLRNAGSLCSKLDWKIIGWPDWGTWTFDPESGYDLTPQDGSVTINISVEVPDQEYKSFSGEIKIVNLNNESDIENIPVRLTTPIKHDFIHDTPFIKTLPQIRGIMNYLYRLIYAMTYSHCEWRNIL